MKTILPSYEVVSPSTQEEGISKLRFIEKMARISHRSEDRQTEDSWSRFLAAVVVGHGDWSVVEHQSATVVVRVDRGVSHEWVRHRLFSFTQESTRFVNYGKREMEFIEPAWNYAADAHNPLRHPWEESCKNAEQMYQHMLELGTTPQIARSVLPNALASTIAVTGNLRTWRWFFLARTTLETHPDFKRVTIPLLAEFKRLIPILYEDIEPNLKQSISMAKVH